MKHLHRFLGPAGVVLLLFGVVSYALTLRFDLWTGVHLLGGAALLAAAISLNVTGFRRSAAQRGTRRRAQAMTGIILFCGILVTLNVLAARHPWRYDATENRIHTLTDKTKAVLASLAGKVEVLAFFETGDASRSDVAQLLDRYASESANLTWRFVDAEREVTLADQLGVRRHGVVVVRAGETHAQASPEERGGVNEGMVTNLVLKVSRPGPKLAYVLTGHGEPGIEDASDPAGLGLLAEALREQNFEVRPLLLSAAPSVPDDAACLLVIGPRKSLIDHECLQLRTYLGKGGRLLLLLDPIVDAGLAPLLADYRIELGDDVIVDQEEIPFLGARLGLNPIVDEFLPHPVTRGFKERVVLLEARSVGVKLEGGLDGVEAHDLAETSGASWAEKDYRAMLETGRVSKGPDDKEGPISIAAASTHAAGSRLLVLGDSDLAINANLDAYFNRELLLRAVEWLAGRDELIAEGPRGLRPSRLNMSEADARNLFRLGVLLLPEALLILGFGIRFWRRSL